MIIVESKRIGTGICHLFFSDYKFTKNIVNYLIFRQLFSNKIHRTDVK